MSYVRVVRLVVRMNFGDRQPSIHTTMLSRVTLVMMRRESHGSLAIDERDTRMNPKPIETLTPRLMTLRHRKMARSNLDRPSRPDPDFISKIIDERKWIRLSAFPLAFDTSKMAQDGKCWREMANVDAR